MRPFKATVTLWYMCESCQTAYPFDTTELKKNKYFNCYCGKSIYLEAIEQVKVIPVYKQKPIKVENKERNNNNNLLKEAAESLKGLGYKKALVYKLAAQLNPMPETVENIIREVIRLDACSKK